MKEHVEQEEDPEHDDEIKDDEFIGESDKQQDSRRHQPVRTSIFKDQGKLSVVPSLDGPPTLGSSKPEDQFKIEQRRKYEEEMERSLNKIADLSMGASQIQGQFSQSPRTNQKKEDIGEASKALFRAEFEKQIMEQLMKIASDELNSPEGTYRSVRVENEPQEAHHKPFEEVIQKQILRIFTSDFKEELSQTMKNSQRMQVNPRQVVQEIPKILSKEEQRRLFEEEIMNQLRKIKTNELSQSFCSITPGQTFRQSQIGDTIVAMSKRTEKAHQAFEDELNNRLGKHAVENTISKDVSFQSPSQTKRYVRENSNIKPDNKDFGFEEELINELSKIKASDVSQDITSPLSSPKNARRKIGMDENLQQQQRQLKTSKSQIVKPIEGLRSNNMDEVLPRKMSKRNLRSSKIKEDNFKRDKEISSKGREELTRELQAFQTKNLSGMGTSERNSYDIRKLDSVCSNNFDSVISKEKDSQIEKAADEMDRSRITEATQVLSLSFYFREKCLSEDRNFGENKDGSNAQIHNT